MITPLGKRILIQAHETASNQKIILTNHRPTMFKVVCIGDEVSKVVCGDIVYLDKYSGMELEHESVKYTVIDESNIVAKVIQ